MPVTIVTEVISIHKVHSSNRLLLNKKKKTIPFAEPLRVFIKGPPGGCKKLLLGTSTGSVQEVSQLSHCEHRRPISEGYTGARA